MKRGFTLIELLLTLAIIAVLVCIAIPKIGSVLSSGKNARAEADCWNLRMAIISFHHDTDYYPGSGGTEDITTTTGFDSYLVTDPGGIFSGWNGPYCDSASNDPWGNSYLFYNHFDDDSNYSCVASRGANGNWESSVSSKTTDGDDIVVWME